MVMTSEDLGLAALKSWQEAFEHPLGITRQIEQRLRAEIASNRNRLRTLVGASYRDLLNTAERITRLDESMQEADALMSALSRNCNSNTVESKTQGAARLKQAEADKRYGGRAIAAQILLLQKCKACIIRLLRDHDSSLLAAKVLSVSRLLLKTLSQISTFLPVLDTLRTKLASLRRHLLRRLDQRLTDLDISHEQLVEAICAFCLATSSSSSDALRHYHHLRLREIRRVLELGTSGHQSVIQALQYYIRSLQTTKLFIGRSLSEALRCLGTQPILRDPVVHALDELDLSTLQRWVAAEIQDFVPFIKHNDLVGPCIPSPTNGWSKEAFNAFSETLRNKVGDVQSANNLLSLRQALLEIWLPACVSTPVYSSSEILETLREVFNKQMSKLIGAEASTLTDVGTTIANITGENSSMPRADSLIWNEGFVTMGTGKGASTFKQQLRMRHLGTMEGILRILRTLDDWIGKVGGTAAIIGKLRKDRWQDHVEEDEDDEEAVARTEKLLQSDDPKLYETEQAANVAKALADFQLKVRGTANAISQGSGSTHVRSLLRIIRETSQRIRQTFPDADLTTLDTVAPLLHNQLAIDVSSKLLVFRRSRPAAPYLSNRASAHLWEGVPPLPVQPSSRTFRLLYKLQETMAGLGGDLWTRAAVDILKKTIVDRLLEYDFFDLDARNPQGKGANGLTNGTTMINGDSPKLPSSAHSPRIQDLFDVFYLNYALAPNQSDDIDQLAGVVEKLGDLSGLEDLDAKVLRRRAKDYWARTNLLFDLLT